MKPAFRIATESDAQILLAMMREYYAFDEHPFDQAKACEALLAFITRTLLRARVADP